MDTVGQEAFQSQTKQFYRGAEACILTFDICNRSSFTNIKKWQQRFCDQVNPENPESFPFMLLGNKNDLYETREVKMEEAQQFAEDQNLTYYEVSAKSGENVELAFKDVIEACTSRRIRCGIPKESIVGQGSVLKASHMDQSARKNASGKKGCC